MVRYCESSGVLKQTRQRQCAPHGIDCPVVEANITYPAGNDYLIVFLPRRKKDDKMPIGSM